MAGTGRFKDKKLASEAGKKTSRAGIPNKKTVLKLALQDRIEDFDNNLYQIIEELAKPPEFKSFPLVKNDINKILKPSLKSALTDKQVEELMELVALWVKSKVLADVENRKFLVKELMKFRVPQKKEIEHKGNADIVFVMHPDIASGDEDAYKKNES